LINNPEKLKLFVTDKLLRCFIYSTISIARQLFQV